MNDDANEYAGSSPNCNQNSTGTIERQRDLLEHALRIQEREYGPNHRMVATTLANLGNTYGELGETERQRELLERALHIKEREYGAKHVEVAITKFNLARAVF